ncbi:MAG: RhuM family protein [Lentimicrobium sp.]|jgi:hypothetical protein|nr:RhuM family protein [Lentimicrobium sp.]
MENKVEIYQNADNQTEIKVQFEQDTVWLTQLQMSALFDKDVRTINEHIKNVYKTNELIKESTIRKFRIVQTEGDRSVNRSVSHYNLDMIISVGYRVNSKRGVKFRQWATQRLKDYLVQGYAINEKRLQQKQQEVELLKTGLRIVSRTIENAANEHEQAVFHQFAKGLTLLDDYDHKALDIQGHTLKETVYPGFEDYMQLISLMYADFESGVFAKPKDDSFHSSINQIKQSFNGTD